MKRKKNKNKKKVLMCLLIKQTQKKKIKEKNINPRWELDPRTMTGSTQIATAIVYLQVWKSLSVTIIYLLQPAL